MPSSTSYRPAEPPDSPDSDLELDFDELAPRPGAPRARLHRDPHHSSPPKIPLRNLRLSGLRRLSKQPRRYGELGQNRSEGFDDAAALLDDDDDEISQRQYSDGGAIGSDDNEDDDNDENNSSLLLVENPTPKVALTGEQRPGLHRAKTRIASFLSQRSKHDEDEVHSRGDRVVAVGTTQTVHFPPNIVSNAKYTAWSFLPVMLYNEFSFFFNMYFLLVALSQAIPVLRIGYISTYIAPLAFVLIITMGKEAFDDIDRRRRDKEANSEEYTVLHFEEPGAGRLASRPRRKLRSTMNPKHTNRLLMETADRLSDIQEEEERLESQGLHVPSSVVQEVARKSKDLRVGDVLKLSKGQRVPADVVILKCFTAETKNSQIRAEETATHEPPLMVKVADDIDDNGDDAQNFQAKVGSRIGVDGGDEVLAAADVCGETFIRTDQLDGETDWKLRLASPLTQKLATEEFVRLRVTSGNPERKVNEFVGNISLVATDKCLHKGDDGDDKTDTGRSAPLSIDNTAWANTVIASHGTTLAVILYTGPQTRSALSTAHPRSKVGLFEYEINSLTKILCALTLALSVILVALENFHAPVRAWYVKVTRFLVLFSTIVPISLRVNLDMGKSMYSWFIQRDPGIEGAVVRTSTIPEDLGRIEYLLSDKTGTLTQNEMELKKIHVGTVSYAHDSMDEVATYIRHAFSVPAATSASQHPATTPSLLMPSAAFTAAIGGGGAGIGSGSASASASAAGLGLGSGVGGGGMRTRREIGTRVRDVVLALALCHNVTPTVDEEDGRRVTSYQASSPDEIAIVKWTESVGLRLAYRDRRSMTLESKATGTVVVHVRVLDVFPFTSEGKRMGILVQFLPHVSSVLADEPLSVGEIWFYQKGADTVMSDIVAANDWLDEETANMAREGLRTLVVGRKRLSIAHYREFCSQFRTASLAISGRDSAMQQVVSQHLEHNLELLGVTGVEDRLQRDVKPSLELLRNAGIKIWMLTGDKVETARCVAISSKLVARGQLIHTVAKQRSLAAAGEQLEVLRNKPDACLLVDGESLALLLRHFEHDFISVAVRLPAVVACRCSPTQKADMARLIKRYTHKRVCCIGDGGNDVSMIQAADIGVGIVGKEGKQASLAADFSILQFHHLTKLLVWHGRNSYKRSAKLAQFVIHRGLIIAVCQTMYSIAINFEPEGLYKDWLLVGYATVYTAMPVLSLVLDRDVDENVANLYPELYKELTEGRSLSYRTFFVWVAVSIYQGCMIQGLSQLLTEVDGPRMVAVSFTALVFNELLMVAIEITTWHPVMIFCIVGTFLIYIGTMPFLGGYFDLSFIITLGFLWRVAAILAVSLVPTYAGKLIRRAIKPPSYRKVQGV